jgi:hypothetical protein
MLRILALFLFALGLTAPVVRAEEKKADGDTHEGKVVKVVGNKLTMSDKEGKNEHTHTLAADAKISCDGKECKLEDLKPGQTVKEKTSTPSPPGPMLTTLAECPVRRALSLDVWLRPRRERKAEL